MLEKNYFSNAGLYRILKYTNFLIKAAKVKGDYV